MKTEKVILSFIAVVAGLLVATIGFYLYQKTKTPSDPQPTSLNHLFTPPSATPTPAVRLSVDQPVNESATTTKIITISGKTDPQATVIIANAIDNQIVTPSANGSFSTSLTLEEGVNSITIISIGANGKEVQKILTVTYSTEEF